MKHLSFTKREILLCVISFLLGLVAAAGAWKLRAAIRPLYHTVERVLDRGSIASEGNLTNVLFVHHSTGANLIAEGNVRALFDRAGYEFWDHGYNSTGLVRPDGTGAGYSYSIPNDNTDPDGFARLFAQPARAWPINAFSAIMRHEVIIFKSCFPVSDITSEDELDTYKEYYRSIRQVIAQHPDRVFIAMTPPPLVPESTTPENAARARRFAEWLQSEEFLSGYSNLYVFDFFDLLAENNPDSPELNMLRPEYRPNLHGDSHPNATANQTIGPQFVESVIQAVDAYRSSRQ